MKVSIIIAAYNEYEYIDQCISSVINQKTTSDLEIIIGDDGSVDGTIKKIEAWEKNYPNIIQHYVMDRPSDNSKIIASVRVSNVLKKGIEKATGDYICFLAGDDFYCADNFIESHVCELEKENNKKCIGCMCDYIKYWDLDNYITEVCPHNTKKKLRANIYWGCHLYIHLSTFVFRNIFNRNIDISGLMFIDDIGMEYLMGQYGDYCYIPGVMFAYRQREGSIMKKNDPNDNRICSVLLYACNMNSGFRKYRIASFSRLIGPVKKLMSEHDILSNFKYNKYFELLDQDNKIIDSWIIRGKTTYLKLLRLKIKLIGLYCCYVPYRIIKILFYGKDR